jgi:superfamily II DNA or RNA helicase
MLLNLDCELPVIEQRDYATLAQRRTMAAYEEGKRGVFVVAPTGSGKTHIFSWLTWSWILQGSNVAIAVHRETILEQTRATLAVYGVNYGIIKACNSTNPKASVQIVSIDSMRSRLLPWEPDYIIVDEAHLVKADRYLNFLDQYPYARRYFTSATPIRTDNRGFSDVCDELIVACTINQLIEHPSGPYLVPAIMLTGSDISDMDTQTTRSDERLEEYFRQVRLIGDITREYQAHALGRKGVVFCQGIAHSKDVARDFNDKGINCEHIDGEMSSIDQRAIRYRLKTGETQIVTNSDLLVEGWDEPSISYVGMGKWNKSLVRYIQEGGRGLRIHPGKRDCIVIDHGENEDRHGHLMNDREWSLNGLIGVKQKKKKPIECKSCGAHLPNTNAKCYRCGYQKVTVLQVTTYEAEFGVKEAKAEHPIHKRYRLLIRAAKAKGRKLGWAYLCLLDDYGKETLDQLMPYRVQMRIQKEEGV